MSTGSRPTKSVTFVSVPLYTYVLGPNDESQLEFYPDISGCELAPNISYLGKNVEMFLFLYHSLLFCLWLISWITV